MFKAIALLKKKPGLSRQQFIDYYEQRHAPLLRTLQPNMAGYRRNFIDLEGAYIYPGASAPDFDVITEIWYADRAGFERDMALAALPDIAQKIAEDEENFLDRNLTRFFVVNEHCSHFS